MCTPHFQIANRSCQDRQFVNCAHSQLCTHVRRKHALTITKIWSDGGPHFKSSGMATFLYNHPEVTIHIRASDHGKDIYDGEGGMVKREIDFQNQASSGKGKTIADVAGCVEHCSLVSCSQC